MLRAAARAPRAATRCGLLACTTSSEQTSGCHLCADERVGSGKRPLRGCAGKRERAPSVRERRDCRVRIEDDPVLIGLDSVLVDERAQQWVVLVAAPEPGGGDHLLAPVDARLDLDACQRVV